MPNTFSTPSKIKIRKEWNLPLLKIIKEQTNKKLIYLGLPSPDADDVIEWIDYIDKVIAFQCREYPNPSDPSQSKEAIDKLESKLNTLETQGKISTFTIYDGYIEEVLLRGRDISNNQYHQNEVITLYNLDYCNSLSAPIQYLDNEGSLKDGYKFDTIDKLMEFQKSVNIPSKKFILFLTVKCDYYEPEMDALIGDGCEANLKNIHVQYENIKDVIEKKARKLRSYTIQNLRTYFTSKGFIPEFLPTINYNGKKIPRSKKDFILLHFTVLGTQMSQAAGTAPFYQNIEDVIKQNFIYIRDGNIQNNSIPELNETGVQFSSENYLTNCESFKRYWEE
jgi:hypothetical protein